MIDAMQITLLKKSLVKSRSTGQHDTRSVICRSPTMLVRMLKGCSCAQAMNAHSAWQPVYSSPERIDSLGTGSRRHQLIAILSPRHVRSKYRRTSPSKLNGGKVTNTVHDERCPFQLSATNGHVVNCLHNCSQVQYCCTVGIPEPQAINSQKRASNGCVLDVREVRSAPQHHVLHNTVESFSSAVQYSTVHSMSSVR